ncbi:hypothetical protein ES708_23049 [subsurface metagenome]
MPDLTINLFPETSHSADPPVLALLKLFKFPLSNNMIASEGALPLFPGIITSGSGTFSFCSWACADKRDPVKMIIRSPVPEKDLVVEVNIVIGFYIQLLNIFKNKRLKIQN